MATPTIAQLQSEINTDSTARGYAALVAAHDRQGLMFKLNEVQATISVKRSDVTVAEIIEAIDIRDLSYPATNVLPAASQPLANSLFESMTQLGKMRLVKDDGTDTTILKNLKLLVVSGGQGSQARLNAAALRTGSRAEQLWGSGTIITEADLVAAGYN